MFLYQHRDGAWVLPISDQSRSICPADIGPISVRLRLPNSAQRLPWSRLSWPHLGSILVCYMGPEVLYTGQAIHSRVNWVWKIRHITHPFSLNFRIRMPLSHLNNRTPSGRSKCTVCFCFIYSYMKKWYIYSMLYIMSSYADCGV
jgi:hypothetical protein